MEKYILFLCLPLLLAGSLHGAEKPGIETRCGDFLLQGRIDKEESFFVNGKRQGPETTYSQCGSRRLETPYVKAKYMACRLCTGRWIEGEETLIWKANATQELIP